jgi:hypothetical protein
MIIGMSNIVVASFRRSGGHWTTGDDIRRWQFDHVLTSNPHRHRRASYFGEADYTPE